MNSMRIGEDTINAIKIVFVSALCKNFDLIERFKTGLVQNLLESNKTFEVEFLAKVGNIEELLNGVDVLAFDTRLMVSTAGRASEPRRTIIPQVKELILEKKLKVLLIPIDGNSNQRRCFFKNSKRFVEFLLENTPTVEKDKDEKPEIGNIVKQPVSVVEAEGNERGIVQKNESDSNLVFLNRTRIIISLPGSGPGTVKNIEVLQDFIKKRAPKSETIQDPTFRKEYLEKADILITNCHRSQETSSGDSSVISHVLRAKRINPNLQVVIVANEVTEIIAENCKLFSCFLQVPISHTSVDLLLTKILQNIQTSRELVERERIKKAGYQKRTLREDIAVKRRRKKNFVKKGRNNSSL